MNLKGRTSSTTAVKMDGRTNRLEALCACPTAAGSFFWQPRRCAQATTNKGYLFLFFSRERDCTRLDLPDRTTLSALASQPPAHTGSALSWPAADSCFLSFCPLLCQRTGITHRLLQFDLFDLIHPPSQQPP